MSTNRQMDKQNMLYAYNGILRNEILMYTIARMNLENIMLSRVSQSPKDKDCVTPLYGITRSLEKSES